MSDPKTSVKGRLRTAVGTLLCLSLALASEAQAGRIVGWGEDYYDVILNNIPSGDDFVAVDAGGNRAAAIRADGSLVSWGMNTWGGQVGTLPPAGNDFVQIATGTLFNVALRADGSLAAWGLNSNNVRTTVPQGDHFVAIAAGTSHAVALTDDGTIVVWGSDYWRQHEASGATGIRAIATTGLGTVALTQAGSLYVWDYYPVTDPADDLRNWPRGIGYVAIDVGGHGLAQRSDGMIVGWGHNEWGQADPVDGSDFASFSAGGDFSLALRNDGSLFAWGHNNLGQLDVPAGNNFIAASAGGGYGLAIQVPEPSTWALLLTSLPAGLILWQRRRRKGAGCRSLG